VTSRWDSCLEKSTVDAIFAVRQLVENYGTVGKDFFVAFIDLEKAFDRVPREVIWWEFRKKVVMEMYREAETAVQIEGKKTAWFEVKLGVHQGIVLSPLLFEIVMEALTDHLNKV